MEVEHLYRAGYEYYEKGVLSEAADCFRELCLKSPRDARSWKALGTTLMRAEAFQEAFPCLDMALHLEPQEPETLLQKAECLLSLKRKEEALKICRQIEQISDVASPIRSKAKVFAEQWSHP